MKITKINKNYDETDIGNPPIDWSSSMFWRNAGGYQNLPMKLPFFSTQSICMIAQST